uniref:Uncharacterized protein n=1 Tax=Glossina austeni TaxID=7395 RepID=A0A1A9V4W4_GLOAU
MGRAAGGCLKSSPLTSCREPKLQELQLLKFAGTYRDCPDFFAIKDNQHELSKIENLQYLRKIVWLKKDGASEFSDKLKTHMRPLQSISRKELMADRFLLHSINSKFDAQSRAQWEELLPINKSASFSAVESVLLEDNTSSSNISSIIQTFSKCPCLR